MVKNVFKAGIDIGSTTAKFAIMDSENRMIYADYRRHGAEIQKTFYELVADAKEKLGDISITLSFTGSAAMGISEKLKLPFVQEVIASAETVKHLYPKIKTLIDIGGEDSKMIFFYETRTPDIRMNGNCAGGTGSFIDQMAVLMNVPTNQLNDFASNSTRVYPIASRCGVFAKTDVQNLLSQKIPQEDIAASIFHAVALQTINALARGVDPEPNILFSGGPMAFLPSLREAFIKLLNIDRDKIFLPERPELIPAMGAAIFSEEEDKIHTLQEILDLSQRDELISFQIYDREAPLFTSKEEFDSWSKTRQKPVKRVSLEQIAKNPNCFLGIDSGSTTTKMILTDENGEVIFDYYNNNHGDHIQAVVNGLTIFHEKFEKAGIKPNILKSSVTGYGEDLIRTAFKIDDGIVETIAHFRAAKEFDPNVSFIMDIGGQDMKAMFINNGTIQKIELNEACSSGCGSFIETFARTLNYSTTDFAKIACTSSAPCDLGTRCTVFMNSKVKQFLKEGVSTDDISAGLAYSVIKNSLYKVLSLRDTSVLGDVIVVQGGSFQNPAIHHAFEKIVGKSVLSPDIPGLMGAYGAALTAKDLYIDGESSFIGFENLKEALNYKRAHLNCKGCENFCTITKLTFDSKNHFYTGNKCEKYFSNKGGVKEKGESLTDIKLDLLFKTSQKTEEQKGITVGIPRVLNFYENLPFWSTLFAECGINVKISPPSSTPVYEKGMGTVMSDNICFPAKLVHGHIISLIQDGVDRIFYPMVLFEKEENSQNIKSFTCPIVMGYPDVIKSSINPEEKYIVPIDTPTLNFNDESLLKKSCIEYLGRLGVKKRVIENGFQKAIKSLNEYKKSIKEKGEELLRKARELRKPIVLLIGRPYHLDPLINQKIPQILTEQGCYVLTEDSVTFNGEEEQIHVLTQWAYPNRIYRAAQWASKQSDVEVVMMNSFGCGPDAIVVDEVKGILSTSGKSATIVRIDEISSIGSIRLRIRTMLESTKIKRDTRIVSHLRKTTKPFMNEDRGRTILIPKLSDFYTQATSECVEVLGYKAEILPSSTQEGLQLGMKYTNNEICYPSILVIGDILQALTSGKYDLNKVAVGITQTGGQCRASTYLSLIKKALIDAGMEQVPVVAIPTATTVYNYQPGFEDFKGTKFLKKGFMTIIYGDAISDMYYTTKVREINKGEAEEIRDKYLNAVKPIVAVDDFDSILKLLKAAVAEFNSVPVFDKEYPKVGIVGEIFIKYNEFGNHHILDWLMEQGVEPVMPPLIDFFIQEISNIRFYKDANLRRADIPYYLSFVLETWVDRFLKKTVQVMKKYRYNRHAHSVSNLAKLASKIVNLINQYGEGWLIPGEVSAFAQDGINHVVCIQPFGCIANHVIAKGVEKKIKDIYPDMNLLYLDLDADTSKANYHNRLHFLLRSAKENFELEQQERDKKLS
ncbi:2-hydroxyacyl-CoA dehydratase [bacterium]|nr:2-hydroxyacyl-CoA dehydratase [bacterium]